MPFSTLSDSADPLVPMRRWTRFGKKLEMRVRKNSGMLREPRLLTWSEHSLQWPWIKRI